MKWRYLALCLLLAVTAGALYYLQSVPPPLTGFIAPAKPYFPAQTLPASTVGFLTLRDGTRLLDLCLEKGLLRDLAAIPVGPAETIGTWFERHYRDLAQNSYGLVNKALLQEFFGNSVTLGLIKTDVFPDGDTPLCLIFQSQIGPGGQLLLPVLSTLLNHSLVASTTTYKEVPITVYRDAALPHPLGISRTGDRVTLVYPYRAKPMQTVLDCLLAADVPSRGQTLAFRLGQERDLFASGLLHYYWHGAQVTLSMLQSLFQSLAIDTQGTAAPHTPAIFKNEHLGAFFYTADHGSVLHWSGPPDGAFGSLPAAERPLTSPQSKDLLYLYLGTYNPGLHLSEFGIKPGAHPDFADLKPLVDRSYNAIRLRLLDMRFMGLLPVPEAVMTLETVGTGDLAVQLEKILVSRRNLFFQPVMRREPDQILIATGEGALRPDKPDPFPAFLADAKSLPAAFLYVNTEIIREKTAPWISALRQSNVTGSGIAPWQVEQIAALHKCLNHASQITVRGMEDNSWIRCQWQLNWNGENRPNDHQSAK